MREKCGRSLTECTRNLKLTSFYWARNLFLNYAYWSPTHYLSRNWKNTK